MATKATQQVRVNTTRYLDEDGLEVLWEKIKTYVAENGGATSIHFGEEEPTDEYCQLWVDTAKSTLYTEQEVKLMIANILGGIENGTY